MAWFEPRERNDEPLKAEQAVSAPFAGCHE